MALYRTRNDIPADAVRLDEDDAIKFMSTVVDSWKKRSEVFYLTYSAGVLSGLSALTGIYLNNYYRSKLRLQSFGRMSTYLPIVVIPAAVNFVSHTATVQHPILIEKYDCPVCLEIKAISLQALIGVTYPMILSPMMGFMMAARYYTYNVPDVRKDPKSLFHLLVKFSKPIAGVMAGLFAVHSAAAAFLTHKQAMEIASIKMKLLEAEDDALSLG